MVYQFLKHMNYEFSKSERKIVRQVIPNCPYCQTSQASVKNNLFNENSSMKKRQKKISIGLNYARTNYHLINGDAKNRNITYFKLKESLQFSELCDAVDFLFNNIHISRKELIISKL